MKNGFAWLCLDRKIRSGQFGGIFWVKNPDKNEKPYKFGFFLVRGVQIIFHCLEVCGSELSATGIQGERLGGLMCFPTPEVYPDY